MDDEELKATLKEIADAVSEIAIWLATYSHVLGGDSMKDELGEIMEKMEKIKEKT